MVRSWHGPAGCEAPRDEAARRWRGPVTRGTGCPPGREAPRDEVAKRWRGPIMRGTRDPDREALRADKDCRMRGDREALREPKATRTLKTKTKTTSQRSLLRNRRSLLRKRGKTSARGHKSDSTKPLSGSNYMI